MFDGLIADFVIVVPHDPVEWLGALASIGACYFAFKAVKDAKKMQRELRDFRQRDVQPRLSWSMDVRQSGSSLPPHLLVTISNAGGGCEHAYMLLHHGAMLFSLENIVIPAHAQAIQFKATSKGTAFPYIKNCYVLLFFCQDTDGTWWDWSRSICEPLVNPSTAIVGIPEFNEWFVKCVEQRREKFKVELALRAKVESSSPVPPSA